MTISEQYRSSTEYREILRILQKATNLQENFLWQSHALGKTVIPIQYLEIDFIAREVLVNFNAEHYRLDPDLPIYVKLDYRTSVFKVTEYRHGQSHLHFSFPELIKTQELRQFPRHTFRPNEDKFVTLRSSSPNMRDGGGELKVRAMDVSQLGLGLVVSEQNRNFLKNNRILWITGLQDQTLEMPILAEVIYINAEVDPKFVSKKQKSLKVGLKISGVFPEPVYRSFLQ
jgi:hypothetical protein